jgi:hypothetical protein
MENDFDTLKGGGDCLHHYHNSDRFPSRDTLLWLWSLERVKEVTTNYTITDQDDIVIVNGSTLSIYLPPARNGRYIRFATISGSATVYPNGTETINGDPTHTVGGAHKDCRLKAISGGWIEL